MNMYLEDLKLTIFILFVGLFFIVFLSAIQVVVAAEIDSILFTEIMYDLEGGDDGYEWVEIYNNTNESYVIDDNWRFYDGSNHLVNIVQGDDVFDIGEVLVITDSVDNFLQIHPDYSGTILDSVVKLNNTGEIIKLSIDGGDNWIAEVEYLETMNESGEGYSLEYDGVVYKSSVNIGGSPGLYEFVENNNECDCNVCTPLEVVQEENVNEEEEEDDESQDTNGVQSDQVEEIVDVVDNEIETPVIYSNKVRINELLPDPDGSDEENEFIELFNDDDLDIDLEGWYIEDLSGKKYILSGNVASKSFIVFYRTDTKITLNNSSGDVLSLFNPIDELVSNLSYDKSLTSYSYSYFTEGWKWTEDITPGSENFIIEEVVEEVVETDNNDEVLNDLEEDVLELKAISDIKLLEKNEEVFTQGVVTVPPSYLADTYFYISEIDLNGDINLSTGIQVYFSKKDFINLNIGDVVIVIGSMSEVSGEKRIKIKEKEDIEIVDNTTLPEVEELLTGEVSEDYEGGLVYVSGELIEKKSSSWYIDDDSGEVRVYISSKTGIEKPAIEVGQEVLVVGIVSETKSGYRLLPRIDDDIIVEKNILEVVEPEINVINGSNDRYIEETKSEDGNNSDYLGYGLGVVGLTMASWALKLKLL
ncbi:MAG: lamin tail domain-containing protein [Candidatus Komeilibacteria bacterium]